MSQHNFIRTVVSRINEPELLDALTKDFDAQTALENIRVFFAAHVEVGGKPMQTATTLMNYVQNVDASEGQKARRAFTPLVVQVISEFFGEYPPTVNDVKDSDWGAALNHAIKHDDVDTLVAMDRAGLLGRSPIQVFGDIILGRLHSYWTQAISHEAARCNRYLLTTSSLAELGGFPGQDRTWPKNMAMARDVVAHIPEAELAAALDVLRGLAIDSRDGELERSADEVVPALLERCSQYPILLRSEPFEQLVAAVNKREASPYGGDLAAGAAVAMLGVLDRAGKLNSFDAFCIAFKLLLKERDGYESISPDYLKALIDRGLPVQSEPGWYDAIQHLLVAAHAPQVEVISQYVPDKTAFMQQFGWDIVDKNTVEQKIRGVENSALYKLAQLGFPFGPIDIQAVDGTVEKVAAYERFFRNDNAADPFVIGHLVGHLDASHTMDGADPVHVAVVYQLPETIMALADKGFSMDGICNGTRGLSAEYRGMTPLVISLKKGDVDCIKALVEAGADPSIKAPTGASTMQLAKTGEVKQLLHSARTGSALGRVFKGAAADDAASPKKKKPGIGML